MAIEIIDSLLSTQDLKTLQSAFLSSSADMPQRPLWNVSPVVSVNPPADPVENIQFCHALYSMYHPDISAFYYLLEPILAKLNYTSLLKSKANLNIRAPYIVEHGFHTDYNADILNKHKDAIKTAIFYVNTNDGYTVFEDGTRVESVANRLVVFPCHMRHTGTSTTNKPLRCVINLNYLIK